MRNQLFFIFSLLLFLASCSGGIKGKGKKKKASYRHGLINFTHCFTDLESNVSFPNSFNDSVVELKGIKTIIRSFYSQDSRSVNDGLKEVREYNFSKEGDITSITIKQIYEHTAMDEVTFNYAGKLDEYGFGEVNFKSSSKANEITEHFQIYDKEQYSTKYLVYSNRVDGSYLFYMKNQINWGGVSVDSILHPTPEDIIAFGVPKKEAKRYQVENRVNEFNVTNVEYRGKPEHIVSMVFDNYPFTYKRNFEFTKEGVCTSFIDSTFSGDQFLMRRITSVELDKNKLPTTVNHVNMVDGNEKGYKEFEKFEYEFYDVED